MTNEISFAWIYRRLTLVKDGGATDSTIICEQSKYEGINR